MTFGKTLVFINRCSMYKVPVMSPGAVLLCNTSNSALQRCTDENPIWDSNRRTPESKWEMMHLLPLYCTLTNCVGGGEKLYDAPTLRYFDRNSNGCWCRLTCALYGIGMRSLDCWDRGFESRCRHGCSSLLFVVCCVGSGVCHWLITRSEGVLLGVGLVACDL